MHSVGGYKRNYANILLLKHKGTIINLLSQNIEQKARSCSTEYHFICPLTFGSKPRLTALITFSGWQFQLKVTT